MFPLLDDPTLPILALIGLMTLLGYYLGRKIRYLRLPSIIGYMLFGVLLGPSVFNLITSQIQENLAFVTDIALGFVAFSIGLELRVTTLKNLGRGIIYIILLESFGAFLIVFSGIYLLTNNLPLALVFGAIAPASAPAGTVAVIQEYKAKGDFTKALYAVVGFDDGLGIIIFGFTAAFTRILLLQETGEMFTNPLLMMLHPLGELFFSIVLGVLIGMLFSALARRIENTDDILILLFGVVLLTCGLCNMLHLSLIFTNMVAGMIVINTQPHALINRIHARLPMVLPLLFILFFTLAGTNLHIAALPSLGIIGTVYVLSRSAGLIAGSRLGAWIGRTSPTIKKYLGLGILSQAGVAIGLSLIAKKELSGLGRVIEPGSGQTITSGDHIAATVLTTVTVTCIVFELIGPILTKYALQKAGEIQEKQPAQSTDKDVQ